MAACQSLNIALSVFSDTHVSVFTFSSDITSSFLLLLLFVIPGESDHVSYMTDKSSCPICKVKSFLGSFIYHAHCSRIYPCFCLLSWFHHYPVWLLIVSAFPYLVPSHFCDPLEDLLPSSTQYGFSSVLLENEELNFLRWYLRIHFHHWWIPLLQLSIITYLLKICWLLSMFNFDTSIHMDCIVLVPLDFDEDPLFTIIT